MHVYSTVGHPTGARINMQEPYAGNTCPANARAGHQFLPCRRLARAGRGSGSVRNWIRLGLESDGALGSARSGIGVCLLYTSDAADE